MTGRVLRSKDPAGLEQEIWALLALYQALRREMVTAVETVPGTDPDRASFTIAWQAARDQIVSMLPAEWSFEGKRVLWFRVSAIRLTALNSVGKTECRGVA